MIVLTVPENWAPERRYIIDVVVKDFLGLTFEMQVGENKGVRVSIPTLSATHSLVIADILFQTPEQHWLTDASLPPQPLSLWNLQKTNLLSALMRPDIPVLYGQLLPYQDFLLLKDDCIRLGVDIFGSIFFMLTRYEEYVKSDRDQLGRFPATASLAYQESFLHRPIVDEYVEILWACMKKLWPQLERKPRQFQVRVSHDVDHPYKYAFTDVTTLTRNFAGDLLKRHDLRQGMTRIKQWTQVKQGNLAADPYNRFDWLMDISEAHNLTSAFYFICDHTDPQEDGNYYIESPLIRQLLRRIHQRGHEIGLHPSFNTYLNALQTQKEFLRLQRVCAEEGIQRESWGGRQHYLRWRNPVTWQNWEKAGLNYDSTLTFPEVPGFRCGTCHEFPVYDLVNRKPLNLIERSLIVMERTVFDEKYLGLGHDLSEACDRILELKKTCRKYRGNFTLLWHNNHLTTPEYRDLYQQVVMH